MARDDRTHRQGLAQVLASSCSRWLGWAMVALALGCSAGPSTSGGTAVADATAAPTTDTSDTLAVLGDADTASLGAAQGDASDAAAGITDTFVPAAIPAVDPEPPPPCGMAKITNDYFQFLDNLCYDKVLPSAVDPEWSCPVADASVSGTTAAGAAAEWQPASANVIYGDLGLAGQLPAGLQVAVILVRRVGGVPHYRYLSNGTAEEAVQPWSTSKFLAAANAAVALRTKSDYKVGLTAKVGTVLIGDLVTSLVNYDEKLFTSNALGAWFHDIGGRTKANALIGTGWLQRPATETFGGNYGEATPAGLGWTFDDPSGASLTITADKTGSFANHLSMHTLAEAMKRLVLHREEASQRLPGIQWPDVRTLLYGAEASASYGPFGGLSADTAIYLQTGHDIDYLAKRANGQWRVFSKLGLGTKGQFVHVGYACFPVLTPQNQPVVGLGREFVIAAHLATGGATWKERDRLLAKAYRVIVPRIIDGTL